MCEEQSLLSCSPSWRLNRRISVNQDDAGVGGAAAEGTTPETTEEPNFNPVKLPHELWTTGNCSQQHATCSSFLKSYHFGPSSSNPLSNNHGGKRICVCLSLPSHSSWMTVSFYSLVSLDCWFMFITSAFELKVFIMAFSYVLHFGCSSFYFSSSPCLPFAHWPFSSPIPLLVSCHIYLLAAFYMSPTLP